MDGFTGIKLLSYRKLLIWAFIFCSNLTIIFLNYRILKDLQISYLIPKSVQNTSQLPFHDESLNVFIVNDESKDLIMESKNLLVHLYSMRNRTNHDFWLLDVSTLVNKDINQMNVESELTELQLDLDDDFYVFHDSTDIGTIKLFEIYSIHETLPKIILPYGFWNMNSGLDLINSGKWERRKNLKVIAQSILLYTLKIICNSINRAWSSK